MSQPSSGCMLGALLQTEFIYGEARHLEITVSKVFFSPSTPTPTQVCMTSVYNKKKKEKKKRERPVSVSVRLVFSRNMSPLRWREIVQQSNFNFKKQNIIDIIFIPGTSVFKHYGASKGNYSRLL